MSIIGNPFEDWVKKQVDTRQKAVAKKDEKSILAYNSKSPWLRLVSGVNMLQSIEGDQITTGATVYERLKASGLFGENQMAQFVGSGLSRNFILFGGISNDKGELPAGLNPSDSIFGGAYGWGSLGANRLKRGYVPPPGITGCSFEYKNDGALAFAKVDMKAYSEDQFQMIDILFQRPGYSCLLEFGHSAFLDNSGDLQYAGQGNYSFNTGPFTELMDETRASNATAGTLARRIREERKKWYGNYEGFFGKITKYNWSVEKDGSYKITVELVGAGDLLASLKTNSGPAGPDANTSALTGVKITKPDEKEKEEAEGDAGNETTRIPVIADAVSSRLNLELFQLYKSMPGGGSTDWGTFSSVKINDFPFYDQSTGKTTTKVYSDPIGRFGFGIDSATNPEKDKMVYLRFISFLAILQRLVNIKDDKNNYALNYDFNFESPDNDENYMCTFPGMFSGDPNEVLISYSNVTTTITKNVSLVVSTDINNKLREKSNAKFQTSNRTQGKLANVYVEIDFITKVLYELRDEETGDVAFYEFLKRILDSINVNLGGINPFRIMFNDVTNTVTIVAESPINSADNDPSKLTTFNTFGLNNNGTEGSFVRDLTLKAELTEEFATMISVGAQNNGGRNNENATAFSTYNKGLVDRLFPVKAEPTEDKSTLDDNAPKDQFEALWTEEVADAFDEVYEGYELGSEYVSPLKNVVGNWSKRAQAVLYQRGKSEANIFLPFNFGVTIDGLSGMKIFESFRTDGKGLPYQYKTDSIALIVKSYSHEVSLDAWTTKLETICKPLSTTASGKSVITEDNAEIPKGKPSTYVKKNKGGKDPKLPPPAKPQDLASEKTRVVLRRLADNGFATYGVMWVFDEDEETVLYTLATIELPWLNNRNGVSCIPPNDKYRVKAMVSSKYGGCFHVIGNQKNEYRYNQLRGGANDPYVRSAVLIHTAPKAVGWLMGCIGPAFQFNGKQVTGTSDKGFDSDGNKAAFKFTGTKGDPKSTGTYYLDPAKGQSSAALAKMYGTLSPAGSYKMLIKNLGDVGAGQLPTSIYDDRVKAYVKQYPQIKPMFKDLKGFE